jgi:predicted nucleic acid-binding protein
LGVSGFLTNSPGGLICEAVLAEVCHLVAKDGISRGKVLEFVEQGGLMPVFLGGEFRVLRELLNRYADTPMDFADACVVRLAEIHADSAVCTTDGDFQFFRKNGREPITFTGSVLNLYCPSNFARSSRPRAVRIVVAQTHPFS